MTVEMIPAATHAVIVGIERYDAGWELPGAANDALRAAAWLRAATVPAEQIILVVDAVNENTAYIEREAGRLGISLRTSAKLADIRDIFVDELTSVTGANLVVFWSGHGVLDKRYKRVLFTGDARSFDLRNIVVNDLLDFLRDGRVNGFGQQIVMTDACANFEEEMQNEASLPTYTFPDTRRREGVRQFVLHAAEQGRTAANDQIARAGRFSDVVFKYLHGESGPRWPPDMPALSRHVDGEFAAMDLNQTPISLLRDTTWAGEPNEQNYGGRPVSGAAAHASIEAGLIPAQLRRLATQLVRVPLLATAEQRAEFGRAITGDRVAEATDPAEHMQHVLTAVLRRNAVDRLFEELTTRSRTEEEQLAVKQVRRLWDLQIRIAAPLAHFASITARQVRSYYGVVSGQAVELDELDEVLEYLADLPAGGEFSPLLRFVARLELLTENPMAPEWFDEWFTLSPQRLRLLRDREATVSAARPGGRLVLDLRAPGSVEPTWPPTVVGHLLEPDNTWDKKPIDCAPTVTGVRAAVNELLRWAHGRPGGDTLALGFLAPRVRFDDIPETWSYSDELNDDLPLGEKYPVVLHSGERLGNPTAFGPWQGKLRRIADQLDIGVAPTILWVEKDEAADPRRISQRVEEENASCIAFAFVPGPFGGTLPADPLVAAIRRGAPYVIWLDAEPADWMAARGRISELVRHGEHFHEVPDRVMNIRKGKVDGFPTGVRLLWDNNKWLPDFRRLAGLEASA